jgi:putative PIN family toxin of toxin-antitoxin system
LNTEVTSKPNPAGAAQPALPGHKAPSPEGRGSDTKCRATGGASVVLDTNIVLDVFVFNDPAAEPIRQALANKEIDWLATQAMRGELARVLAYPKIAVRLTFYKLSANYVLARFDQHAHIVAAAPKASVTCRDADDQAFIDLAVQHRALLLSKDRHVISMTKRLLAQGIRAQAAM